MSADSSANGWFVTTLTSGGGTFTLTITPNSAFDGTIEMVNVHQLDTNKFSDQKANITDADSHPCIIWGGDLYIGS